jgi:hypothetical protein
VTGSFSFFRAAGGCAGSSWSRTTPLGLAARGRTPRVHRARIEQLLAALGQPPEEPTTAEP